MLLTAKRKIFACLTAQNLRIMKCIAVLLLAATVHSTAHVHAQTITLHFKKAALPTIFSAITKQTGMLFLYEPDLLRDSRPVTIAVSNAALADVLDECLHEQSLLWHLINRTIVISRKSPPADTTRTITGLIFGHGSPLAGASVQVKSSTKGTYTDDQGRFLLHTDTDNAVLVISSVGFTTQEITLHQQRILRIDLVPSPSELDQAVVIGYGTTTKRLNTGSVGQLTQADIEQQPVTSALQALQARIPGLNITQNTGLPGGDFTIQLRGQNSIRPDANDLLFIVDGVPFPAVSLHGNLEGANGAVHPLNAIAPQDIQSIEVLKDADATAIYGSRGANGVVLITTKKGQPGKPRLSFHVQQGFGTIARNIDLLDTRQYLEVRREAFTNDGASPDPAKDVDLTAWDSAKNTDWQKTLLGNTARLFQSGISYSGGNEQTTLLIGANYSRETTVIPGDFRDEKKSAHLHLHHHTPDKKFELGFTANYQLQDNRLFKNDITWQTLILPPNTPPLYDPALHQVLFVPGVNNNPYQVLLQPYRMNGNNFVTSSRLAYHVSPSLEISASLGYSSLQLGENNQVPIRSLNLLQYPEAKGTSTFSHSTVSTWIAEPQVKWQHVAGPHRFSVLTGLTFQESKRNGLTTMGSNYSSDDLLDNPAAASSVMILSNAHSLYRYSSCYARLSYTAHDRYLLNLTGRTDASSRFGAGKRVAQFGAVGAGWIFSRETFVASHLPFLHFGKIRGSYGLTGNDQIGDYGYLDQWVPDGYTYGGTNGLMPFNLQNDQYSWETNRKLEFAVETGWLDNRLSMTVAWYRNRSSSQLIGYPLPATTGYLSIQSNFPATVQNTGWEAELSAVLVRTPHWTIEAGGNISFPKNKLIAYPGIEHSPYVNSLTVGQSLFTKKRYHFTGLDEQTGIYVFEDVNKDDRISYPRDILPVKSIAQQFFGAGSLHVRYKQLSLDVLVQFVRQTALNYLAAFSTPGMWGNQPVQVLDRWRAPGDHATVQQYTQNEDADAYTAYRLTTTRGDNAISDASFVRLKNVHLSYTLAPFVIFVKAQNLFTITRYDGMDPENANINRLPPMRMIAAGVQFNL